MTTRTGSGGSTGANPDTSSGSAAVAGGQVPGVAGGQVPDVAGAAEVRVEINAQAWSSSHSTDSDSAARITNPSPEKITFTDSNSPWLESAGTLPGENLHSGEIYPVDSLNPGDSLKPGDSFRPGDSLKPGNIFGESPHERAQSGLASNDKGLKRAVTTVVFLLVSSYPKQKSFRDYLDETFKNSARRSQPILILRYAAYIAAGCSVILIPGLISYLVYSVPEDPSQPRSLSNIRATGMAIERTPFIRYILLCSYPNLLDTPFSCAFLGRCCGLCSTPLWLFQKSRFA